MKRMIRLQKQNSGFSLVELIIAIAILVIVSGAVCGFIIVTSRNYANGNNDISVQQEAQLALNQISDVLIDATQSINYVGFDSSRQPVKVLKDSEFTFSPSEKALVIYNNVSAKQEDEAQEDEAREVSLSAEASSELQNYMILWQQEDESVYFSVGTEEGTFPMPGEENCELLAENVTDFQVDLSQVEERRVVELNLNFEVGNRRFEMSNNITVRNKVVINTADIEPLDRRVHVNIGVKETSVVLEPGESYHFSTPRVTGTNVLNKNVTWEIVGTDAVASGTKFTDKANGILQIAENETHQSFLVKVTTEAENTTENAAESGDAAEATITVYVKRVTKVTLAKTSEKLSGDNDEKPGALEVMQGSTVTLGGTVDGIRLGSRCDSCAEDPSDDKNLCDWKVLSGSGSLENGIEESENSSVTFTVKADAVVGSTITIQATSLLSKRKQGSNPVRGELTLTVVEKKNSISPFSGILQHGIETRVDDVVFTGFNTAVSAHALVVHIVDNSNGELAAYVICKTNGWNIWLSPDYFNLDLKKSYTFYLQGIESVSSEEYERYNSQGGSWVMSSIEEIGQEYDAHSSKSAPFAYTGQKFKHSAVYSTILEPVQLTYGYNNKKYCASPINFNATNILAGLNNNSPEINILDNLVFYKDETTNLDRNSFTVDDVKYSIYTGDTGNSSEWKGLYVFNSASNGGSFDGSTSYSGCVQFGTASGLPTIKINQNEVKKMTNVSSLVSSYHIVPGIWYDPRTHIGNIPTEVYPTGYQFPVKSASKKYVLFEENTFHVPVTAEGTMDISSKKFNGSIYFPLPSEMKNDTMFNTDLNSTEWHEAKIWDKNNGVTYYGVDSSLNLVTVRFNSIQYRYIQSENYYEVEPMWVTNRDGGLKITFSYGVYKCSATGNKWECIEGSKETSNANISFTIDGKNYKAYFPFPNEDGFWFKGNSFGENDQYYLTYPTIIAYPADNLLSGDRKDIVCEQINCQLKDGCYVATFVKEIYKRYHDNTHNQWNTEAYFYGRYGWYTGDKEWSTGRKSPMTWGEGKKTIVNLKPEEEKNN